MGDILFSSVVTITMSQGMFGNVWRYFSSHTGIQCHSTESQDALAPETSRAEAGVPSNSL